MSSSMQSTGRLRALRVPNYRRFLAGQMVGRCGVWVDRVAVTWLVLRLTHSGLALGLVVAAHLGPRLVLGRWGGLVATRIDRRRLMVITTSLQATLATLLAAQVFDGQVEVVTVDILVLAMGSVAAVDNPTRRMLVKELVPEEALPSAIGLGRAVATASGVVGPALAAIVVAGPGLRWGFVVAAAASGIVVASLVLLDRWTIHGSPAAPQDRGQLTEGFRQVSQTLDLLVPLVLGTVVSGSALAHTVTLPLLAARDLSADAGGFAWLLTSVGAGVAVGTLVVARRPRIELGHLVFGAAGATLTTGLLAVVPSLPAAHVVLGVLGLASALVVSGSSALVRQIDDPAARNRTAILFRTGLLAGAAVGGLLLGGIAQAFGARVALGLGALVTAGATAWAIQQIYGLGEDEPATTAEELVRQLGGPDSVRIRVPEPVATATSTPVTRSSNLRGRTDTPAQTRAGAPERSGPTTWLRRKRQHGDGPAGDADGAGGAGGAGDTAGDAVPASADARPGTTTRLLERHKNGVTEAHDGPAIPVDLADRRRAGSDRDRYLDDSVQIDTAARTPEHVEAAASSWLRRRHKGAHARDRPAATDDGDGGGEASPEPRPLTGPWVRDAQTDQGPSRTDRDGTDDEPDIGAADPWSRRRDTNPRRDATSEPEDRHEPRSRHDSQRRMPSRSRRTATDAEDNGDTSTPTDPGSTTKAIAAARTDTASQVRAWNRRRQASRSDSETQPKADNDPKPPERATTQDDRSNRRPTPLEQHLSPLTSPPPTDDQTSSRNERDGSRPDGHDEATPDSEEAGTTSDAKAHGGHRRKGLSRFLRRHGPKERPEAADTQSYDDAQHPDTADRSNRTRHPDEGSRGDDANHPHTDGDPGNAGRPGDADHSDRALHPDTPDGRDSAHHPGASRSRTTSRSDDRCRPDADGRGDHPRGPDTDGDPGNAGRPGDADDAGHPDDDAQGGGGAGAGDDNLVPIGVLRIATPASAAGPQETDTAGEGPTVVGSIGAVGESSNGFLPVPFAGPADENGSRRNGDARWFAAGSGNAEAVLRDLRRKKAGLVRTRVKVLQKLETQARATPDVAHQVESLAQHEMLHAMAALQPAVDHPAAAACAELRSLAHRVLDLDEEIARLDLQIEPLANQTSGSPTP
jgi:MFS family permease